MSITDFMSKDHRHCDEMLTAAEKTATTGDWALTQEKTEAFLNTMETHFTMEEEVLFPALEDATGMTQGPTQVMRQEHEQMRTLFGELRSAIKATNQDEFLGVTETLLIMMQQHNMKEEGMLYPMSEQQLEGAAVSKVMEQMQQIASQ